jgi:hypothetical protein
MTKCIVMLALFAAMYAPYRTLAQTPDSTTPATPNSNWKSYKGESSTGTYRYRDMPSGTPFTNHLFVGGAFSLGYSTGEFLVGANPYVGYTLTPWLDGGVVLNFQYFSLSPEATYTDASYHNTLLGAGVFARVFPISFLFLQVQPEYNTIWQKQLLDGQSDGSTSYGEFSLLVGGGIKFGPSGSKNWAFISVLFDVAGSTLSPYNGPGGVLLPVFRAGYNFGFK